MLELILAIAILYILFFLLKKQRVRAPQFLRKFFTFKTQGNSRLQQRLLRLLHGDKNAVRRLIEQAKSRNPGRSENWYYEKVISDLESDRR
ncbi:MAG: hypothetical protein ACM37W_11820 [Actinomycetota bacterium]